MAIKLDSDDEPITEINITPFVDIVLVLLIIFMVTAKFIVDKGINLDLPTAQTSETILKKNRLTISILKDSTYVLNETPITLKGLKDYIEKKLPDKKLVSVTIRADKSVPYHILVQLMDALRLEGISNFALQMNTSN